MKKILNLVLIGVLCLTLVGCGSVDNDNGNDEKASKLINCSSLITSEDVGGVLDVDIIDNESEIDLEDRVGGYSKCVYSSEAYMFQIFLYQDALLNETAIKNDINTAKGFRNLVEGYNNKEEWRDYIITVNGIGEEAYLTDMTGLERWTINILQSGYRIDMIITYQPLKHTPFEGENEWKVEKLKELGKLAVEKLKNNIK